MAGASSFFQYQEQARRTTGRLVILFIMAVAGIVAATYVAVVAIWTWMEYQSSRGDTAAGGPALREAIWEPRVLAVVLGGVLLVVGVATLYRLIQLRSGGAAVAESLGGRLIDPSQATGDDRKVLNVVEEMAIASGIPVPPVYLLDEEGINAFAAGYTPDDAVVAVTRGCVKYLSRDELQGVIAHEFSHIFNGDMRLNIRMIGLVYGILAIGLVGWGLIRASLVSGRSRHSYSSRRNQGGGAIYLLVLGAALLVIGYVGTFFGNLIKAAVSRQREHLADASAVQYTRNPAGIGGALKKIGGFVRGSRIEHPDAEEMSHMFFSRGTTSWLDSLYATHPSLGERIRRIEPQWDGQFVKVELQRRRAVEEPGEAPAAGRAATGLGIAVGAAVAASAAGRIGQPSRAGLDDAAALIGRLPESVRAAAREPYTARALVYALLLDDEPEPRGRQMECLRQVSWPDAARETQRLHGDMQGMDDRQRLPAVELAMPALRRLSGSQYAEFRDSVETLVRADNKLQLFEWMVRQMILRSLDPQHRGGVRRPVQYYGLGRLGPQCSVLLSALAHMGQREPAAVQAAFDAGAAQLEEKIGRSLRLVPAGECNYDSLEAALDKLNLVAPRLKERIVQACLATVLTDGRVTAREAELLRGMLAILGCPMPPEVVPAAPPVEPKA